MANIIVLPDAIASRIAAGEVVERPASALKELVENAIDAGARTIEVRLESGGRDALTVIDDGEGMGPDDVLLALERHATSKIRSDADLETVRSLGFRGEAVPSIASVSKFRISSRDARSEAATVAEVHGGALISVGEEPAPRGTRVEVGALFYNAPARRKFLKSAETERQRASETVARFAIGYPAIRFRLIADGRTLIDHAAVASPFERCAQVFGRQLTETLLPVDAREGALALVGLASGLSETRAHTRDQHFYVNRRPVKDRLLSHAVLSAYGDVLPRGRHPVLVLLLEMPSHLVDVNVHPTKAEVRFRGSSEIHQFVASSLKRVLREAGAIPSAAHAVSTWPAGGSMGLAASEKPTLYRSSSEPTEGEPTAWPPLPVRDLPGLSGYTYAPRRLVSEGTAIAPQGFVDEVLAPVTGSPPVGPGPPSTSSIAPLGQFLDSYLLASADGSLLLVDQHAAHERVLFERLLRLQASRSHPAQRLLVPRPIEIPIGDRQQVVGFLADLNEAGFEIEEFDGGSLMLRALPAGLDAPDPERLLRDVLSDLREGRPVSASTGQRRVAASIACHAAIKIHAPLTPEKMAWLLDELIRCETPTTCPHGRPIVLRIGRDEIERGFHRR